MKSDMYQFSTTLEKQHLEQTRTFGYNGTICVLLLVLIHLELLQN